MLKNIKKYLKYNHFLISHDNWEKLASNKIEVVSKKGITKKNFITRIIKCNYNKELYKYHNVNEGDKVFLSKYMVSAKKFDLPNENNIGSSKFSNLPMTQILGVFRNEKEDLDSLEILDGNILIKPVNESNDTLYSIQKENKRCVIGEVIKYGKGGFASIDNNIRKDMPVTKGDIVLFWENTATPILIDGTGYLCIGDYAVVGKFPDKNNINLDVMELSENKLLLKDIRGEETAGGLYIPKIDNQSEDDYTSLENRYEIIKVKENKYGIKIGDIAIVLSMVLKNININNKTIYAVEDIEDIEAVIIK